MTCGVKVNHTAAGIATRLASAATETKEHLGPESQLRATTVASNRAGYGGAFCGSTRHWPNQQTGRPLKAEAASLNEAIHGITLFELEERHTDPPLAGSATAQDSC
jgi:hypothetical protein